MMKNILKKSIAGVLSLVMVALVSCESKEKSLLNTIPGDVTIVASIDADKILKEAGCEIGADGDVSFTADVEKIMNAEPEFKMVKDVLDEGKIHLDEILFCLEGNSETAVLTFRLDDEQALWDIIARKYEKLTLEARSGFTVCGEKGKYMLAKDGQFWYVDGSSVKVKDGVEFLDSFLARADEVSIADVGWKAEKLLGDEAIKTLVLIPADIDRNKFTVFGATPGAITYVSDVKGEKMTTEMQLFDIDGKVIEYASGLADIDASFVDYLTSSDIAVFAMGIDKETRWGEIIEEISPLLEYEQRGMLAVALPYLKSLDGTVAVALGSASGSQAVKNFDLKTWDITAVLSLADGKADEFKDQIKTYAGMYGLPVNETETGLECSIDGMTFFLNVEDNKLIFSNREIMKRGGSIFDSSDFEGKKAVIAFDIAYNSEFMKALEIPYGVNASAWSVSDEANLRLRLNGTSTGILKAILEEIAKNVR